MAKILTQEEVDALLDAVATDETALPDTVEEPLVDKLTPAKKCSVYNFRRPDRISKEQLRSLHFMHDRFARNLSASMSAYLRTICEVNLVSVEQLSYAEFLLSLPDPTSFNAISMKPLEGNAALELNPSAVFPIIDKLLGGPGVQLEISRSITEIEQNILESVIRLALEDLKETWRQVVELDIRLEARETSPQLIQIVTPNEVVVLIVFEVKIGEAPGMMNLCIPTSLLEPISGKFDYEWSSGSGRRADPDSAKKMMGLIINSRQEVSADIIGTRITVDELINLQNGDMVLLHHDSKSPTYLSVAGQPKLVGCVVVQDSVRAFVVNDKVSEHTPVVR